MKKTVLLCILMSLAIFGFASCSKEHSHKYGDWIVIKEVSCGTNGEMSRYCDCGDKQIEIIYAKGHTEVVDPAIEPTCTETGLTKGKHCSICGTITVAQNIVPVVEHVLDADGMCTVCDRAVKDTSGIIYEVSDDGTYAKVTGYSGSATKIKIADFYNGIPVTTICDLAFWGNEHIFSVTIPKNVTDIGEYVFDDCDSLTSIEVDIGNECYKSIDGNLYTINKKTLVRYAEGKTNSDFAIPDHVTTISHRAFYGCKDLTSIVMPDSVTTIDKQAFYLCTNLASIVISKNVTTIGEEAFGHCKNLASVIVPDSVTDIGDSALYMCISLVSIEVDKENEYFMSIDGNLYTKDKKTLIQYAIGKKDSEFTIPEFVTTIGDGAFGYCKNLASVIISDNVTTIGNLAFYNCTGLTSVIIPDTVTTIGWSAFSDCCSLISIAIPDGVTVIDSNLFYGCDSFISVVISNSVTTIGWGAFDRCTNLTYVYYTGTEKQWNEIEIDSYNNDILLNANVIYNYVWED